MGVQSSEGQVMFSSIALLQQRFRELERIREKREERLLHVLPPPPPRPAATASLREMPVKWFFHPELLYPCRPLRDTTAAVAAASLFPAVPTTVCECKSFQLHDDSNPIAVELWPSKTYKTYNYKHVSGEVNVDTSLHL
ncbi:uncharacterized protein [Miscanthus floridulus]|uniref:uncharacterized protein n=1 Tax=Miscanthus floridulus TaxID=154761 RepID=UPI0034599054